MLVGLVATFLICGGIYGRVNNFAGVNNSNDSVSDNISQRRLVPFLDNNSTYNIYGAYNFVDEWNFDDFDNTDDTYTFTFDSYTSASETDQLRICPAYIDDRVYYLNSINIYVDELNDDDGKLDAIVYVHGYDNDSETVSWQIVLYSSERYLSEVTNNELYNMVFYNRNGVIAHGNYADIWNRVFTHDDNAYTTTYSGYYNFNVRNDLSNYYLGVFGYITFNNVSYLDMTNANGGGYNYNTTLSFDAFDVENNYYYAVTYSLPFNSVTVISNNVLFTNVKMTVAVKNRLSALGTFSYVRDSSYDDVTFKDLLFSIFDSPLYFINRLLSFELFGVNLFVAFTGLLTIVVILVCIRKFW